MTDTERPAAIERAVDRMHALAARINRTEDSETILALTRELREAAVALRRLVRGGMRLTYDPQARAAYVYLDDDEPVLTTREVDDRVNIDLSADARAVGVELLDVDMPIIEVLDAARPATGEREGEDEHDRYREAGSHRAGGRSHARPGCADQPHRG